MRVAILGVGLIGGSIGLAARSRADAEVCGYDPDEAVGGRARELGAIDTAAPSIAEAVAGAEVVFVATPVGALERSVAAALAAAPADCVVSDVGSTKRLLAAAAADERFVGGHPLAGAETEGVEHAREDLFDGAVWYLTPAPERTAGVLYERLHALLRRLGARPTAIDAETHDRMMACVSHLPHVLANLLAAQAAGLFDAPQETVDGTPARLPAVGPSFRDGIRVAGANTAIWTDIYISNRDALLAAIDEFADRMQAVRGILAGADADGLGAWNDAARGDRDALLGAGLTGEAVHELRVPVPNRPGVIAEIALALGGAGVNIVDMALSPSQDNSRGVVALWIAGAPEASRAERLIGGLGLPVLRP
jgi:prephenate dehydrogenase